MVGHLEDSIAKGTIRLAHPLESRNGHQTVTLLGDHRGAPLRRPDRRRAARRREGARQGAHLQPPRQPSANGSPRSSAPSSGSCFNTRIRPGEHFRCFPISNWTELDVWLYIQRENIPLPPMYYAHERQVMRRKGLLVPLTEVTPPLEGETVETVEVRFRTVGDMTCTCPVESPARNAAEVVAETLTVTISERGATRMDDRTSDASMEKRKKEGLFLMQALRFLTAGSVDDGKSTLIGRLLFDSQAILADQLDVLERRAAGSPIDLSLLTDGLEAEREQGITIDVAYRYFATKHAQVHHCRRPRPRAVHAQHGDGRGGQRCRRGAGGHHQARPDAARGALLPQTRRHSLLAQLLRVPSIVFAINKIDALAEPGPGFAKVKARAGRLCQGRRPERGRHRAGERLARRQRHPAAGRPLVERPLAAAGAGRPAHDAGARAMRRLSLPVQYVQKDAYQSEGAGFQPRVLWGRIAHGSVKVGDEIEVLPSRQRAVVAGLRRAAEDVASGQRRRVGWA